MEIAIVGASLAGIRGAEALRRLGFDGPLRLVGAERHRPYDRPPLSKEVLRGEREPGRIALVPPDRLDALGLDLHLGVRAESLDPEARLLALSDGTRLRYDGLLIATGARPRPLPGAPPLAGIHLLRTLDDCLALRAELARSPRVAVVGAGFIGAEVAASCRQLGLEVTIVETLPAPLAAALPAEIGRALAAVHRDRGVELRLGVRVEALEGGSRVERVALSDGTSLAADVVVVGIGVVPETRWLEGSGLDLADGVMCDATLATRAPGVVAAGDVARWAHPQLPEPVRVEHWTNAVEQGEAAARRLLSGPEGARPYAPVPFVWSDQYDLKIQMAGFVRPGDRMEVVHGTLAEGRFVALFAREGRLSGAVGFGRPRQLMGYRRLLREGAEFEATLAQARRDPAA